MDPFKVDENKQGEVEFGLSKKRKRGKPLNVKAFNKPVDLVKEHNDQDDLFQKELLDVVVDRKEALMNAVTTNANPATVVQGLETVVKGSWFLLLMYFC